jgi:hypothetical protein
MAEINTLLIAFGGALFVVLLGAVSMFLWHAILMTAFGMKRRYLSQTHAIKFRNERSFYDGIVATNEHRWTQMKTN